MRRGEVWWAEQPEPVGRRPVLLDQKDGLPQKCAVNLDTITTVRKLILTKRICSLTVDKMEQVDKAIKFTLALE